MTVNPGRAKQSFISSMYEKIEQLHNLRSKHGYHFKIQVDGSISDKNIKQCINAGADLTVSGEFIFKDNQIQANIEQLNNILIGN